MDIGAIIIIIIIGIILVLTFYLIGVYNALLDLKNKVEDKFKPINKGIKKYEEFIEDLSEIVLKHAKHEEKIINEINKSKAKLSEAKTINEKIKAYKSIDKTINKISSLEETYKELKTSRKYKNIQKELNEIEEKITYAEDIYNTTVTNYNNQIEINPYNIIAKIFKFNKIELL